MDSQSERGWGSVAESHTDTQKHQEQNGRGEVEITPGKENVLGKSGFRCGVWSVINEGNVKGFKNLRSEAKPEIVGTLLPQGQVLHSPFNKPGP